MTNPAANRRRGSKWETDLVKALREQGLDAERLHLQGREDESDIAVRFANGLRLVIEAKSGALHPTQHLKEADVERENYAKHRGLESSDITAAVFGKLPRYPVLDGYAMLRIRELLTLLEAVNDGRK